MYDLLIRAGRVVCPATGWDGPGAVAVQSGRIAAVGAELEGPAASRLDFPEAVLLPGLVDLHAHPARGDAKYGIDPDIHFLPRGVTTVLSQGDAGAWDWRAYQERVIDASQTRVRLALNLSRRGELMPGGCFEAVDDADVDACAEAVSAGGEAIWGIAVNVSALACGQTDPREMLARALAAAERAGRPRGTPLLYGMREADQWSRAEQLALLRPGDVVTYCFRGGAWSLVDAAGRVWTEVWEARRRGVLFDVGHGMQSFDFAVAEAAIAEGFVPDTISSDQYARHVGASPPHDLPRTMSKLIAAGMAEADAFAAVTARPAAILGLAGEVGTLAPGACADLAVLRLHPHADPLHDVAGVERPGGCWEPVVTVRAGELIWPERGPGNDG